MYNHAAVVAVPLSGESQFSNYTGTFVLLYVRVKLALNRRGVQESEERKVSTCRVILCDGGIGGTERVVRAKSR